MFQRSLNSMPTDAGHGIRPLPSSGAQSDWGERALQRTWRSLGGLCVLIGLVNAFVPVLPTTVFLLIGAWAYGKGGRHAGVPPLEVGHRCGSVGSVCLSGHPR